MTHTDKQAEASEVDPGEVRVKIPFEGDTVDAVEVDFRTKSDGVQVLELADGAAIEFRHAVRKVYRVCGRKKEDGSPIYLLTGEAKLHVLRKD
jgi:hypothetical protein